MQTTVIRLDELKTKIISVLKEKGPSLPVQLTSTIERDTMFVGAILSDLVASKQVKVSHAKIGGSRLYYLPGQEQQLSKLYDHLPMREKEAYTLLKERTYVKNADLEPAIRVAMYNLKDFATSFQSKGEWYWRWHIAPEMIVTEPQQLVVQQKLSKLAQKRKPEVHSTFTTSVQKFMEEKNITPRSEEIIKKNREYAYTISVPSSLGDLSMLLIAKNKKVLNEQDLIVAHNLAQTRKLPALVVTTGYLTKKALLYREKHLNGLLIVHTIP